MYLISVVVVSFPFVEIKDNLREIVNEFIYTILSLFMLRNAVAGTLSDSVVSCFKWMIIANIVLSITFTIVGYIGRILYKYCFSKIFSKVGAKYRLNQNDDKLQSENQIDPSQAELELEKEREREKYERLQDYYNKRKNIFNPIQFYQKKEEIKKPSYIDHEKFAENFEEEKKEELPPGLRF